MQTISSPRCASSGTSRRPMNPVPPAMKVVMALPPPNNLKHGASVQAIEPHRAASQHLMHHLRRQRSDPVTQHLRGARKEAVLMRIVGRPHDLVRADIAREGGDAA